MVDCTKGDTALHTAVRKGDIDAANKAINIGHDLNERNDAQYTAVLLATTLGHKRILERLLHEGANVNLGNKDGETPLLSALKYGQEHCLNPLLSGDVKPNPNAKDTDGRTCLHYVAERGLEFLVNTLLSMNPKAEIDAQDSTGATPLYTAICANQEGVVRTLLKWKANPDVPDNDQKWTPLHAAVSVGSVKLVRCLLETAGIDKDAHDYQQLTPLMLAVSRNQEGCVDMLLAHKVDVNKKKLDGRTALHMAAVRGYKEMCRLLLANGADVNIRDDNNKRAREYTNNDDILNLLADRARPAR